MNQPYSTSVKKENRWKSGIFQCPNSCPNTAFFSNFSTCHGSLWVRSWCSFCWGFRNRGLPFQDPIYWRYLPYIRPIFQAYVKFPLIWFIIIFSIQFPCSAGVFPLSDVPTHYIVGKYHIPLYLHDYISPLNPHFNWFHHRVPNVYRGSYICISNVPPPSYVYWFMAPTNTAVTSTINQSDIGITNSPFFSDFNQKSAILDEVPHFSWMKSPIFLQCGAPQWC